MESRSMDDREGPGRRDHTAIMAAPMLDRRFLLAAGSAAMLSACSGTSTRRPDVDFIIPYAPGGGFDSYVRTVLPALQKQLGVEVHPDNVDGAAGARAANLLYRGKSDGSVISIVNIPGTMILQQQGGLPFDLARLTWLANMGRDSYGLVVSASSSIKTIDDLRALGRMRVVQYPCVGPAGAGYSATKIGSHLLGIPANVISGYKGTNDYLVAVMRGDGDAAVASLTAIQAFRDAGSIRVLCTFESKGSLPGVPDATMLGQPDLADIVQLRPIAAPPGLPDDIKAAYSKALVTAMRDPAVTAWAQKKHASLAPDDAEETLKLLQVQSKFVARWKDLIAT
jgi:tripartite-type tricarboxylate transporter receptor subunit TctC